MFPYSQRVEARKAEIEKSNYISAKMHFKAKVEPGMMKKKEYEIYNKKD
jgi:hypothetical protein